MRQLKAIPPIVPRTLLLIHRRQFFLQRSYFLVELVKIVDLGKKFFQPLVDNLFRDLLFIERHQLFDRTDALFEVLAQGEKFTNHNRRARQRLQNAVLPPLNSLGDFHFAFAREQRNSSHLA